MKLNSSLRASLFQTAASLALLPGLCQGIETNVNAAVTNINVGAGDSLWFDSTNTNAAIGLQTINGSVPATGPLPGWAHTQWSFLKYNGTQVVELANADKAIGAANLAAATATMTYYDNAAATTFAANQTIGNIETARDFLISNGVTLNLALGGLMFHNNSHWVKVGTGSGFVTSSSGTLAVVANGGSTDYQVNTVVIKDYDGATPLKVIKTGGDPMRFSGANTYTGGTWVNNGRLSASNLQAYGTGLVQVVGPNAQIDIAAAGTFANALKLQGNGWAEGTEQRGALRFESNSTFSGPVTLTGPTRIALNGGTTGILSGALTGTANLEVGIPTTAIDLTGTLTLSGNASGYTGTVNLVRGRLNLNGAFGGNAHVSDGLTLGVTSTIAGNLAVGDTTGATLSLNPATPISVGGNLSFAGASKISLATLPDNGSYPVINYTGTLAGAANVSIDNSIYRKVVTLDTSVSGVISVNVTGAGHAILWNGATTANWDVNTGLNWTDSGSFSTYLQGDTVVFPDGATTTTLNLVGLVQPEAVYFNNSTSDYTLNGFGNGIVGTTGIWKSGTGTVSLGGQNSTYTGAVLVNAGKIKLLNAEAFGFTSGITIAAGASVDFNGQQPGGVGHPGTYTISGDGPDGLGAISNSGAQINEGAGIRTLILSTDASLNGNAGRFDIGYYNGTVGTITGNGNTLTLNAGNGMGVRGDSSGTPIHYVINTGRVWAESTDNALGGATGTVLVKNGAKVGTYGPRTIATPVTLESGGGMYVEGANAIGSWSGAVAVSGTAIFDAGDQQLSLTGTVSGTAAITKTGANTVTMAHPAYVGDTTVSAGVLSLGEATLSDSATLTIAAAAKLTLTHGQADTVGVLIIDGVTKAAGSYGATGSGATTIDDAHFAGTGRVVVAAGGVTYASWASAHGVTGAPNDDDDHDGISNGIEFVIGGNPTSAGDQALLPTTQVTPTSLVFTFRLTADSSGYNPMAQYSGTLDGWVTAQNGVNGVTVTTDNGTTPPTVTVTIPRSLATTSKFFARLNVTVP